MAFEDTKKDPNFIYAMERNIKAYMLYVIAILALITIVLAVAIALLTPLKETKPYLVFFSEGDSNFVRITEANLNIRSDEMLLKSILAGYVKNRETINRINDIERYEIVRTQSDKQIWAAFKNLINAKNSIYTTKNLYRSVRIINVSILNKEVATVDFMAEITNQNQSEKSFKKYRAALKYDFVVIEDTFNALNQNPTGFIVSEYAVTEIMETAKDSK